MAFAEISSQLQLSAKKLVIDCPTRWNSTYEMLVCALKFKDVFIRFAERDSQYVYLPSEEDWDKVEAICQILEAFNSATLVVSGSNYPTSNLYLTEVPIKEILDDKAINSHEFIQRMVKNMKEKFDKYWGEMNMLMVVATILDPRCKFGWISFVFKALYSEEVATSKLQEVRRVIHQLFNDYVEEHNVSNNDINLHNFGSSSSQEMNTMSMALTKSSGWKKYDEFVRMVELAPKTKTELEIYLEENVYICDSNAPTTFDALEWWKVNNIKFRVLTKMAADILAIPISTVASEATFSAGGRIIDPCRASLSPETVQGLVCGGDWVRILHGLKKKTKEVKNEVAEIILPKI